MIKSEFPFVKMDHERIITNEDMNIDNQTQTLY